MPAAQRIDIASAIFIWDYESANVNEYQIMPMVRKIRNCLNECIGARRVNERAFAIFCNVREISSATTRAINRIRNVDLVHVDSNNQANATDEKIKQKLHQINMDAPRRNEDEQSSVIVLISGNCEFGYFLSNMSRNGWRVLLLHPPLVSHDFVDCAEFHYDLSKFVAQIVDEQHRDQLVSVPKCVSNDQLGYLLVMNLPMNNSDDENNMPTERIMSVLHTATEDAHGRVIYFNQMACEAVLTFYAVDNASKGLTAAVLGKNVRLLLGGATTTSATTAAMLEALAIKDPSSELTRMKFTVQQHIVHDGSALLLMHNSNTSSSGHWSKEDEIVQTTPSTTSSTTNNDRISPSSGVSSSNLSIPAAPASPADVVNTTMPPAAENNNNKRSVIVIETKQHKVDKTDDEDDYDDDDNNRPLNDDEYPPLPPASNSIGNAGLLQRYSDAVKRSQSSSASAASAIDSRQKHVRTTLFTDRKRFGRGASNNANNYHTSLYFQKPAMQCYHWDNPQHLKHANFECKFWHPRERCRFYPTCKVTADACGYAHPFCDIYCECETDGKDLQKNHRLNPITYQNKVKNHNYISSKFASVEENGDGDNVTEEEEEAK